MSAALIRSVLCLASLFCQATFAYTQELVDLELVFALDASASVDSAEWALQTGGIARAIEDPAILSAIAAGANGKIAVSIVAWASSESQKDLGPWYIVSNEETARQFANHAATFPRRVNGGTGLGAGLGAAIRHLERNTITAARQVVDVSGDGPQTQPRDYTLMPRDARGMANARGVTINALAIMTDHQKLDRYFANNVIIGSNSFVQVAENFQDFRRAMKIKLLREIMGDPFLAHLPRDGGH